LRELPIAAGLQIMMWHSLQNGNKLRWDHALANENSEAVGDIVATMQSALTRAEASDDSDYEN